MGKHVDAETVAAAVAVVPATPVQFGKGKTHFYARRPDDWTPTGRAAAMCGRVTDFDAPRRSTRDTLRSSAYSWADAVEWAVEDAVLGKNFELPTCRRCAAAYRAACEPAGVTLVPAVQSAMQRRRLELMAREERRAAEREEREESERAAVRLERPDDAARVLEWADAVAALPHRISDAAADQVRTGARAVMGAIIAGGVQWSAVQREDVRAAVTRAAVHVAGSITDRTPDDDPRELACWALWSVVGAAAGPVSTH